MQMFVNAKFDLDTLGLKFDMCLVYSLLLFVFIISGYCNKLVGYII